MSEAKKGTHSGYSMNMAESIAPNSKLEIVDVTRNATYPYEELLENSNSSGDDSAVILVNFIKDEETDYITLFWSWQQSNQDHEMKPSMPKVS